jgi:hypothetical protein
MARRVPVNPHPGRRQTWAASTEEDFLVRLRAGSVGSVEDALGQRPSQATEAHLGLSGAGPSLQLPIRSVSSHSCTPSSNGYSPSATPVSAAWQTPKASSPSHIPHYPSAASPSNASYHSHYSASSQCGGTPVASTPNAANKAASAPISIAVIAPGAGTGINGAVYAELNKDPRYHVEIVGQSRTPYDCYPPCWPHGCAAPNLESFANEVVESRIVEGSDCLVFGSRGGQVVLPYLWNAEAQGRIAPVPPAFVINGGCAMNLPTRTHWPDSAVTFLMIGGQDNFRGHFSIPEYIEETRSHVPKANRTTAILFVEEMVHMPQQTLLYGIIGTALRSLGSWKASRQPPLEHFRNILSNLHQGGWSGHLLFTSSAGVWEDIKFSGFTVGRLPVAPPSSQTGLPEENEAPEPLEFTRQDELKALWKAAVFAQMPSHKAPMSAGSGNRVFAVAKAATAQAVEAQAEVQRSAQRKHSLRLPVPVEALRVPSGHMQDPTPISRALGLPARRGSTPVSPNNPCTFFVNDPSPSSSACRRASVY